MRICCLVIAIGMGLGCAAAARADLVWEFNPATKTAALSGTTPTTAAPFDFGSGSVVVWSLNGTIPGGSNSLSETTGTATYNLPTPVTISNDPNNNFAGYQGDPFFSFFDRVFYSLAITGNDPPPDATITGNGAPIDYSNWDPAVQSYFESFTASSPLVLTSDQTTSLLSVYAVSAVPEASSFLLVGLVGVGVVGRMRWKRRAK